MPESGRENTHLVNTNIAESGLTVDLWILRHILAEPCLPRPRLLVIHDIPDYHAALPPDFRQTFIAQAVQLGELHLRNALPEVPGKRPCSACNNATHLRPRGCDLFRRLLELNEDLAPRLRHARLEVGVRCRDLLLEISKAGRARAKLGWLGHVNDVLAQAVAMDQSWRRVTQTACVTAGNSTGVLKVSPLYTCSPNAALTLCPLNARPRRAGLYDSFIRWPIDQRWSQDSL